MKSTFAGILCLSVEGTFDVYSPGDGFSLVGDAKQNSFYDVIGPGFQGFE